MELEDFWEGCPLEDTKSVPGSHENETTERKHEELEPRTESLYERYGNNEPYTKPENTSELQNSETLFKYVYRNQCPSTRS